MSVKSKSINNNFLENIFNVVLEKHCNITIQISKRVILIFFVKYTLRNFQPKKIQITFKFCLKVNL